MMDKYDELIERLDGVKHEIGLALGEWYAWTAQVLDEAAAAIEELLNVKRNETCTDCPLYDKDNHRCPRFNAVIPRVIEEALDELPSAQPEIIRCEDCLIHGVCRFEQGLGLDGYCSQAERRQKNE